METLFCEINVITTYLIIYPTIEQDCQPLQRTTKTTTATVVTNITVPPTGLDVGHYLLCCLLQHGDHYIID